MSEKTVYVRATLWILAAHAAVLLVGLLARPLVARFLQPAEYGSFALVLATANVLQSLLVPFATSGVLIYFIARHRASLREIGAFFYSSLAGVAALAAVLAPLLFFFAPALVPGLDAPLAFAALLLALGMALVFIVQCAQQGLERFRSFSAVYALSAVLAALASLAAAFVFRDALSASLARGAAFLALFLAALPLLRLPPTLSLDSLRRLWAYGKWIGIAGVAAALAATLDRYVLAAFRTTADVGHYDIALALASVALPFSFSLFAAALPAVARDPSKLPRVYTRVAPASMLVLTLFSFALFAFGDHVIRVVLGSAYAPALAPLRVIAAFLPLAGILALNTTVFLTAGKPKNTALFNGLSVVLVLGLNLALVPGLGGTGAALAYAGTNALLALASSALLLKRHGLSPIPIARQYLLFLAALAALVALSPLAFPLLVLLTLAFAAGTLALHRTLARETLRHLREIVKNKLAPPAAP